MAVGLSWRSFRQSTRKGKPMGLLSFQRITQAIVALFALISILTPAAQAQVERKELPPLEVVSFVDLDRYLGKWYEIARLPAFFQRKCAASTAIYTKRDDGLIGVLNECREKSSNGKVQRIEGKAWVEDTNTNAKLRVRFFWPFSGDYWIIELDRNYQYVVVSEPNRKYLWILSRTPQMDPILIKEILVRLREKGFDTNQLIWDEHEEEVQ
jgi:apolipoprotein D and lipocalin family protein